MSTYLKRTTQQQKLARSTQNGLAKTSTADALNIRSVSNTWMIKKIGVIDDEIYMRLVEAMRVVLGMVLNLFKL